MHYYTKTGESQHEIVGKNGKLRPTTLRDAKVLNLVPSVTTIMDIMGKPGLVFWLQQQVLLAAIETPYSGGCPESWKRLVVSKSKKIGEDAAKRGNEIHDLMEKRFQNIILTVNNENNDLIIVQAAVDVISEMFPGYLWTTEQSFAHKDGFGGRVDLYGKSPEGSYVVIDFKTKDKTDPKDMVQYDEHKIQLAAYQVGLGLPYNTKRFNLFISVNKATPGLCKLVECKEFDKYKEWFYTLVRMWQLKNGYKPNLEE